MRKNVASQVISAQMVSSTDGSNVTSGTTTVYTTIDGGTQDGGVVATHEGNGCWSYAPSQALTNGDHISYTFVNSSAISVTVNVYPVSFDYTDSVRLGMTALPNAAADGVGGLPISDAGGLDLDTILDVAISTRLAPTVASRTLDVTAGGAAGIDWSNVENPTTTLNLSGTNIDTDQVVASVSGNVDGNVTGSVGSVLGGIDTSGGTITTLDALDTAQDTQHSTTQGLIGTPTDLGGGATLSDNNSDIAGATFSSATDSNEALRNRGDAAWITGAGGTPPQLLQSTTIATLASQTSFTLTAGSADNDAYNGAVAVVTDQSTSTQKAVASISDYVGSTLTVTLAADPAIFTMAVGDTIEIIAALGATAADIRAEIDSNSTQLAAIVADTNELQSDDIPGLIATAQADLDIITGVDGVNLLSATQASIDAIEADTNEVQGDLTNGGRLDLILDELTTQGDTNETKIDTIDGIVDSILVDTGTTIPATLGTPTAADIATDLANIQTSADGAATPTEVNAEVVDALTVDTYAESTGVPAATSSIKDAVVWTKTLDRNRLTQTSTTQTLRNDADSGNIATAATSDDGTTAERSEWT